MYEKNLTAAKVQISERKTKFIWVFPSVSNFGAAKVTKKRAHPISYNPVV
jgi:hypothetical protein